MSFIAGATPQAFMPMMPLLDEDDDEDDDNDILGAPSGLKKAGDSKRPALMPVSITPAMKKEKLVEQPTFTPIHVTNTYMNKFLAQKCLVSVLVPSGILFPLDETMNTEQISVELSEDAKHLVLEVYWPNKMNNLDLFFNMLKLPDPDDNKDAKRSLEQKYRTIRTKQDKWITSKARIELPMAVMKDQRITPIINCDKATGMVVLFIDLIAATDDNYSKIHYKVNIE